MCCVFVFALDLFFSFPDFLSFSLPDLAFSLDLLALDLLELDLD